MRYRAVWLIAIALTGFMGLAPGYAQDIVDIAINGGFEDGVVEPWTSYSGDTIEVVQELTGAAVPEGPIEGQHCLHVVVPTPGANTWDNGMKQPGHVFEQGKKYTFSTFLKCKEGTLDIRFKPELDGDPYTAYGEQIFTMTEEWAEYSMTTPVITADVSPAAITFHMGFAVGDFWVDGVRFYEGDYVPPVFHKRTEAASPSPDDGAGDTPQDVILGWEAGELAGSHNVYFGTVFDDVNDADAANPLGVLVSEGQSGASFDPEGLLEFGRTYYWRIDEVNATPDRAVFRGDVWSFTVEPFVYPIENIIATASSFQAGSDPENTINGSGLNADDQHSIEAMEMWLTIDGAEQPAWIQYEFDGVYKLHEMSVWNYNVQFDLVLGYSAKNVTVEYSTDGVEWTALGDFEFARGTAQSDYQADTMIDLAGAVARYVRLTVVDNWGDLRPQFGLSEVRFLHKPVQARQPNPADGAANVDLDVTLDWRGGREAVAHEIYVSSDRAAVEDGTALVDTVTESRYGVDALDLGRTYYWKINEANEAASPSNWEGDIWSFSTKENLIVEDFESYDDDDHRIYETWIDGYEIDGNGSTVGYLESPFAERSITFGGRQSMPLLYDNTGDVTVSETERDLGSGNWTLSGADTLTLHFRGNAAATVDTPGNDPVPLYVAVEDTAGHLQTIVYPDPEATVITTWQTWRIPFSVLSGVNLNSVAMIHIGVGDRDSSPASGTGLIFIDEIQVGHPGLSDPGASGLVAYYALEENVEDSSGNENHGTVVGGPVYVEGQVGSALEFDGTGAQYVDLGTLNPSAATGQLSLSLWVHWNGLNGQYQGLIGKRDSWAANDMMWQIEANIDTGVIRFQREGLDLPADSALPVGEWTHVAVAFDGARATMYFDGAVVGEGDFSLGTDPGAATQFGAAVVGGGNPFNGALDEIRIYDRVLSSFEIRYLAGQ